MNNGVRRKLNFNAVAKKWKEKAPTKKDHIQRLKNGIAQLKNANKNPQNIVNRYTRLMSEQFDKIGYNDVLTKHSQSNLANSVMVSLVTIQNPELTRRVISNTGLQSLYNKIGKNKKIKKNTNVNIDDIIWIAHGYIKDQKKAMKDNKAKANNNARNAKRKEQANAEAKRKTNAKAKRNKAAQNKLNLLNNNEMKAFKNAEVNIKQLEKDIATIKRKDKQGYKKLNGLNPKLSKFYKLNINEGLTGNERQAYKKLEKEHDDIMNTLKKQVEVRRAKEKELEKLKNAKAKILKNAANAKKKIKGIAKGAIQKAIAANKVRVKREKENAKSVANIAKIQAKINGYQNDIKLLGNMNTFDKKIKKLRLLFKIKEYQRDQLSEQTAPFERNIRDEFGQKAADFIDNAIWGQDVFINALKRRNLNTFDKIKTKFGNTFMNNMDKLVTRRKKLVQELNDTPNDIEKLKQEKVIKNKADKENKLFNRLDKKAMNNMKHTANVQQELKEKEEKLKRTETAQKELLERQKELRRQAADLLAKGQQEFGIPNWFTNGNHEHTDLYKLRRKVRNEEDRSDKIYREDYNRIKRLKSDIRSLKTKIDKGPKVTKDFILYSVQDMLDDRGIKGKDSRPFILKLDKDNERVRENKYQMFKYMVAAQLFNIPYFLSELKTKGEIPEYKKDIIDTIEKIEKILRSGLADRVKNYLAIQEIPYSIAQRGDVQKILNMNIPNKWKSEIIKYQLLQMHRIFDSGSNIKLVQELLKNSNDPTLKREVQRQTTRYDLINKIKTFRKTVKSKQVIRGVKKGKEEMVKNTNYNIAINDMNNKITKKVKEAGVIRKELSKLPKTKNASKKASALKSRLTRRNTEIKKLTQSMQRLSKAKTVTKPRKLSAGKKITTGALAFLTRQGVKNSIKKKKVINRFLGKLAQDTRPTLKQKYRLFTDLVKPDSELNFLSQVGNGQLLEDALTKRRMVCHLFGKNQRFVRTYIPGLRQTLYTLASQYFEQHDKLNNVNDRKDFHKKFLNRLEGASAFPCLEGSITALTTTVIDPGLNWRGHYGLEKIEMVNDVNKNGKRIQRKGAIKVPINLNKSKDIQNLRDIVFGTKLGAYYGTLLRGEKNYYRGLNTKKQLQYMWTKFKDLELLHGRHLTAIGETGGRNGDKIRKAFVDSFKLYGNAIYNNDRTY